MEYWVEEENIVLADYDEINDASLWLDHTLTSHSKYHHDNPNGLWRIFVVVLPL